jgi:hypothetical protein
MKTTIYYKTSDHGLLSHIYEHLVANKITKQLRKDSYLPIIDYRLPCWSYALTTKISIESSDENCLKLATAILEDKSKLTPDECITAATECSCEYGRKLQLKDNIIDGLLDGLSDLHQMPWTEEADFAGNTPTGRGIYSYASKPISYGDVSQRSFTFFKFKYHLSTSFCSANKELKPLAVMVILALSQYQIRELTRQYTSYDLGDKWSNFKPYIRYMHELSTLKSSAFDLDGIGRYYDINIGQLAKLNFANRLSNFITGPQLESPDFYYDDYEMNEITSSIIGKKGRQSLSTSDNINKILQNLQIKISHGNKSYEVTRVATK